MGGYTPAIALGAALWLAACGGGAGMGPSGANGEEAAYGPWMRRGEVCVRESQEPPLRRIVNRVDPELCGRKARARSPFVVRRIPQE